MGATATGKTELALDIARRFSVEIVSVDSAQIYRGMDIGTAKPARALLDAVPHHLVDIIDPTEHYSAWDFVQQSRQIILDISRRGRLPLLTGGTMMYFHAFEAGLNRLPEADHDLRQALAAEARDNGLEVLYQRLREVDPASAKRIKPNDSQRIQRALEVYQVTGKPLSVLQQQQARGYDGKIARIVLAADERSLLHQRIQQRFQQMLDQGLIDEGDRLRSLPGFHPGLPSMRCVGYRQVLQYLLGELDRNTMVDKALAATRQLAKRQITWLRKQSTAETFDCLNYRKDDIFRYVESSISAL